MKLVAVSIWMFVNLTVIGLCAYIYILWSQYWKVNASAKVSATQNSSLKWPISQSSPWHGSLANPHLRARHFWNSTLEKKEVPNDKIQSKINTYKNQLIVQFRQAQLDASNVLYSKEKSRYGVNYQGPRLHDYRSPHDLLCALKKEVRVVFLGPDIEPFHSDGLSQYFPSVSNIPSNYNTCAIVSSAGSMYKSQLGKEIDSHDAVLRFNSAPTIGYEDDVGSKTTFRIVNSQVVSKPQFDFFHSPLYKNVTLMAWDPANYTVNLKEWFKHPEFNIFQPYFKRRKLFPNENFYIFHPKVIWDIWDFIQSNTAVAVLRNPPSSGFLGIVFLLHHCNWVDIYEYIPSMRLTKRCHYFDIHDDVGCTFGNWHPLASEKLLTLAMNSATDTDIFYCGYVRIQGFKQLQCP